MQCDALGLDNSEDQTQNTTMRLARVIKSLLFTKSSIVEVDKAFCSLRRHLYLQLLPVLQNVLDMVNFLAEGLITTRNTHYKKKRLFTRVKTFEKGYFDGQDDCRKASIETPSKKMFRRPTQRSKKVCYLYRQSKPSIKRVITLVRECWILHKYYLYRGSRPSK